MHKMKIVNMFFLIIPKNRNFLSILCEMNMHGLDSEL